MKVGPFFFLESFSLSLLYPAFAFDIWYVGCVCVCVCVLEWFRISLLLIFSLCMCGWVFWDFFVYIYIYIYMFVSICVCIYDSCLFIFSLNLPISSFSFIWSSVLSFVWYIGIILNLPRLHWYRCFDTFNFLLSSILILLLWSNDLVLRASFGPMYISLHLQHSIM